MFNCVKKGHDITLWFENCRTWLRSSDNVVMYLFLLIVQNLISPRDKSQLILMISIRAKLMDSTR